MLPLPRRQLKPCACLWDVALAVLAHHGTVIAVVAYVVLQGADTAYHRRHGGRGEKWFGCGGRTDQVSLGPGWAYRLNCYDGWRRLEC